MSVSKWELVFEIIAGEYWRSWNYYKEYLKNSVDEAHWELAWARSVNVTNIVYTETFEELRARFVPKL